MPLFSVNKAWNLITVKDLRREYRRWHGQGRAVDLPLDQLSSDTLLCCPEPDNDQFVAFVLRKEKVVGTFGWHADDPVPTMSLETGDLLVVFHEHNCAGTYCMINNVERGHRKGPQPVTFARTYRITAPADTTIPADMDYQYLCESGELVEWERSMEGTYYA